MIPEPGRITNSPFFFLSSKLRRYVAVRGADQGLFQPPVQQPLTLIAIVSTLTPVSTSESERLLPSLRFLLVDVVAAGFLNLWEGPGSIDNIGFNLEPPVAIF